MNSMALGLSLASGLCTGIGGIIGVLLKGRGKKAISMALGFSAGIMITVSLSDILPHAIEILGSKVGVVTSVMLGIVAIVAGMLVGVLINTFIPEAEISSSGGMYRLGLFSLISLMAHNLPEGIAVYLSGCSDTARGVSLAVAIGLHNIPEGIAVSLPIYAATGNAKKGILYAFLSGLAEPLGAVLAWLFIGPMMGPFVLEYVMAMVSGLMLYVAFSELIPTATQTGGHSAMSFGALLGVVIMSISIYLI